jgi:antitoxin HicB
MKRAPKKKQQYSYHIVLRAEPEGGYTVLVPSLPGCITYGRTVEEAHEMAHDAIRAYLQSLRKDREHIPQEKYGSMFATATVSL